MMEQLFENIYLFRDTCNVYAVCNGHEAVLIDFGDGRILPHLTAKGITVTDVLMTHHHRDQGQGLPQAVAAGIRIWVPHTEQDFFAHADEFWQARNVMNNYNTRQDRFSVLASVPIAGTLRDYATYQFCGLHFVIIPTPGHTTGSISLSLLGDSPGFTVASESLIFSGDLIAAPGKVWSLAATQWSYSGAEGIVASILSLLELRRRQPERLLPSHGNPIDEPAAAIDLLLPRLREILDYRRQNQRLYELVERPYQSLTPHLLRNRTSMSNAYVLLSDSGKALFFDFGYDFMTGIAAGQDRASRRPWLYTLPALKEQFGVSKIDVVLPTHHHDDHVAGLNLLRDIEGTQVWAAENFADILQNPTDYDLPCLWYDPIPVDRLLPLAQSISWKEYELTLYPLPGHTHYAVAIFLEVDGKRVLVSGDQYQDNDGLLWNHVYQNDFEWDDYISSAKLYRHLDPDLILSGHWEPQWVDDSYFDALDERGTALARLHRHLLPAEMAGWQGQDAGIWLRPYQTHAAVGATFSLTVYIRNPLPEAAETVFRLVTPDNWQVDRVQQTEIIPASGRITAEFTVTLPPDQPLHRARVAVDITINGRHWGQLAEALVSTSPPG